MIITCQSCKTQYSVPDNAIPADGKKVKCVKCKHIWHQKPITEIVPKEKLEELQPIPKEVDPIPPKSNLPTKHKKQKIGIFLPIRFALYSLMAIVVGLVAFRDNLPGFSPLYDALGFHDMSGLVFQDFTAEKIREDNKIKFIIKGDIINESKESRKIVNIQASILSKGGRPMSKFILEVPETILEPGEKVHVTPEINNISGNAEEMTLDIGNKWDLMFR